ncbi:MAG: hypothetical protein JW720_14900 [Sedimentisphaerales bacterium]|nr:hypothetical protein [Sedimentisphaerales bacterium]
MIRTKIFPVVLAAVLFCSAFDAFAFNGHVAAEGPLKLAIAEISDVTQYDHPCDVRITLANTGDDTLNVTLNLAGLIDQWRAIGDHRKTLEIPPHSTAEARFEIAAGRGAFSALYPVHVYAVARLGDKSLNLHAVRVFESDFSKAATPSEDTRRMTPIAVPVNGTLPLWTVNNHRLAWQFYDKPLVRMPVGFIGTVQASSATFGVGRIDRGIPLDAIIMHPPWKPAGGTVFAEYGVKLPNVTPIVLHFANAIRDTGPAEPPSDGVTFRVWVGDEKVFERHTDSKKWIEAAADLSAFAGKQILLRIESHPGPKRDTTCDSSYWGRPVIVAGTVRPAVTPERQRQLRARAAALAAGKTDPEKGEFLFNLEGPCNAAIVLGPRGIVDAAIAFSDGDKSVVFDGLRVAILKHDIGADFSPVTTTAVIASDAGPRAVTVKHSLSFAAESFDLTARIRPEKTGLRIAIECPERVTDIALGPADREAPKVYYGHGYCIVEPQPFIAHFGGHNLSTSHVGFDFDNGISLLAACDNPPDFLEVVPQTKTYALHTHMNATFTFVPGVSGAFDCARRYRPLYDKEAAPAFKRKAGRFVFDIWGGRYENIARTMQQMIDYGLTDSLLTLHVWQRWGYDYRLPDIYPPQPGLGSIEGMRKIAAVCAEHDIPWGLHDNYIDFYPDAEAYSYDHICFTEAGLPVKAWINEGRDAQSYRWRPDSFMPFVQRNLRLIASNLKPTHYFIDVFTSIGPFDYYDSRGNFHSMLETRQCWGLAFAWIRDCLGGDAPQTSEAGHDQLIGYLDGADCQHLRLTPDGGNFCIKLPCKDWQRVPWFDVVLHDKFSLHGVGYPGRYEGGRSRRDHGIESDDYISAEILLGHAMMIDARGFGPAAVRKYWLAQDFIRSIATDTIENVEFASGDIHRQIITYASGAKACVNRGEEDWQVAGKILPQYGYFARNGRITSSIERIDGIIVEQSDGPSGLYVNARAFNPNGTIPVTPSAEKVEYLGDGRFKMTVEWDAKGPAPKDLQIFIHFTSDKLQRQDKIAFQSGGNPVVPTTKWTGRILTGADWIAQVPPDLGPGQYDIRIGLWDPSTGRRYHLFGDDDGSARYRLGKLIAEGDSDKITNISLIKYDLPPQPAPRWNLAGRPVDFGGVKTDGALRCRTKGRAIVLTPLLDAGPATVELEIDKIAPSLQSAGVVLIACDRQGRKIKDVDFTLERNLLQFRTEKGHFEYLFCKEDK